MAKILVTDDDAAILEATKLLLEHGGHEVVTATSGNEIRRVAAEGFDLILLDIWLSGENGADLARQLKSDRTTSSIPIIMFSANRDIAAISDGCGATDYLIKPFDLKQLYQKVSSVLDDHSPK